MNHGCGFIFMWDPDCMDVFEDVWSSEKLVELQSMQQGLHSEAKEAEMSLGVLTVKGLSGFAHINSGFVISQVGMWTLRL